MPLDLWLKQYFARKPSYPYVDSFVQLETTHWRVPNHVAGMHTWIAWWAESTASKRPEISESRKQKGHKRAGMQNLPWMEGGGECRGSAGGDNILNIKQTKNSSPSLKSAGMTDALCACTVQVIYKYCCIYYVSKICFMYE